jgi:MoaA/NifB/PqqE/SkfB family radical SAM enzyme
MFGSIDPLLEPGPIRQVRLDLTTRCNLRCVYCAVSHPSYRGTDMSDAVAKKAIALIVYLAQHYDLEPVDLNGHGETTFRANWTDCCFELLEHGVPLRLTSNFAKPFDMNELEALACMENIAISIDTADERLLQRLRRRVDLRQIMTSMTLVRAAALKLHRPAPKFGFISGVYDKNALEWEAFARFSIAAGISYMIIWNLAEHSGLDISEEERVRPLDDLPDDELKPRLSSVLRGLRLLRQHDVAVTVLGGFIEPLAGRVGLDAERNT